MRICGLLLVLGACWTSKSSKTNPTDEPISNAVPSDARATTATDKSTDPSPPDESTGRPGALRVTNIDPPRGDAMGGTYVLIEGERFISDGPRHVKVYFGSRQGSVVRFASDTQLIVEAPGGKPNERVDVLLVFDPGGQIKLPNAFTFVDAQPSQP